MSNFEHLIAPEGRKKQIRRQINITSDAHKRL